MDTPKVAVTRLSSQYVTPKFFIRALHVSHDRAIPQANLELSRVDLAYYS